MPHNCVNTSALWRLLALFKQSLKYRLQCYKAIFNHTSHTHTQIVFSSPSDMHLTLQQEAGAFLNGCSVKSSSLEVDAKSVSYYAIIINMIPYLSFLVKFTVFWGSESSFPKHLLAQFLCITKHANAAAHTDGSFLLSSV